jgi:hypothetical protein
MGDEKCPLCCEDFATDPSAIQDRGASRLPLTCVKCFNYTLCCACLSAMYSRRLEGRPSNLRYVTCSACANPKGFDGREHVINRTHCRQLLRSRELGECVAPPPKKLKTNPEQGRGHKARGCLGPSRCRCLLSYGASPFQQWCDINSQMGERYHWKSRVRLGFERAATTTSSEVVRADY